jgi:hypothetical protein
VNYGYVTYIHLQNEEIFYTKIRDPEINHLEMDPHSEIYVMTESAFKNLPEDFTNGDAYQLAIDSNQDLIVVGNLNTHIMPLPTVIQRKGVVKFNSIE